jgi:hypothetical protein
VAYSGTLPAPGWYADPAGEHHARYWDGSAWTGHVSDAPAGIGLWDAPPRRKSSPRGPRVALVALGVVLGLVVVAGVGAAIYQYRHRHDVSAAAKQLLKESPFYLDASAVLPGFTALDSGKLGFNARDLGLEGRVAQPVAYQSRESSQAVVMLMGVASTASDKRTERSHLDDSYLEQQIRRGLKHGEKLSKVQWRVPALGEASRFGTFTVTAPSFSLGAEALIELQPRRHDLVVFVVVTFFPAGSEPAVHATTIGQQLLANLGRGN